MRVEKKCWAIVAAQGKKNEEINRQKWSEEQEKYRRTEELEIGTVEKIEAIIKIKE